MYLTLEPYNLSLSRPNLHAIEKDGVKFITGGASLHDNGTFIRGPISGNFRITGIRPGPWHDGKMYYMAIVESAEASNLSLVEHTGWTATQFNTKRCFVPSLNGWINAQYKSRIIKQRLEDTPNGRIWVGSKRGELYFAGLESLDELSIRTHAIKSAEQQRAASQFGERRPDQDIPK